METIINDVHVHSSYTDDNGLTKSNVIYEVLYTNLLVDAEGNVSVDYGTEALDTADLSNHTDYDLLDNETVKSWLISKWSESQEEDLKNKSKNKEFATTKDVETITDRDESPFLN